MINSNK